ncbi:MAG: cell envelope integrity protein TolA [Pseudomonadota bacterium]
MIAAPRFQHVSSGGLALGVHGLFVAALVLSMSWKNPPHLPVQADLWAALPEAAPAPAPIQEVPEPAPEPPPQPASEAVPKPSEPAPAEIALRKAEQEEQKRQAAEAQRRQEEVRKAEEARRLEERRQAEEQARREQEAQAAEKAEKAEKERIEQLKREFARQREEQLAARQVAARQAQVANVVDEFRRRIQAKVQSYVRVPPAIAGNPEAVFQVSLFANGEVRKATLLRSSGVPAYDVEVERAILKASPLPLPDEKEAAAAFRDGLTLKFRPFERSRG